MSHQVKSNTHDLESRMQFKDVNNSIMYEIWKGASIYHVRTEGDGVKNAPILRKKPLDFANKERGKNPKITWTSFMEAPNAKHTWRVVAAAAAGRGRRPTTRTATGTPAGVAPAGGAAGAVLLDVRVEQLMRCQMSNSKPMSPSLIEFNYWLHCCKTCLLRAGGVAAAGRTTTRTS